jgi:2-polyprenyl-3-methyl-5-hydroxy-6-metoxy-1,4-benzoquinol methylase
MSMDHPVTTNVQPGEPSYSEETDPVGLRILELFSGTRQINRWMYDQIAPFCKGRILEIGSGIGNISDFILRDHEEVTLSDVKPAYCRRLEQTFGDRRSLRGICPIDLADSDIERIYPQLAGAFDTVIALNVVEHIGNHEQAIRNARKLLRVGGKVVILVPAYRWLYNPLDKELGHFRRYNRRNLSELLVGQHFEIQHTQYFNAAAVPGWWISGNLCRMKEIQSGPLYVYDGLVPMLKLADRLLGKRFGLSVIAVGVRLR